MRTNHARFIDLLPPLEQAGGLADSESLTWLALACEGSLLVAGREITSFSVDRRGNYHESANGVIAQLNGP